MVGRGHEPIVAAHNFIACAGNAKSCRQYTSLTQNPPGRSGGTTLLARSQLGAIELGV